MSFLSEVSTDNSPLGTFGYEGGFGAQWESWRVSLHIEHNLWLQTQVGDEFNHVLNVGLGGEVRYFKKRLSSSIIAGTSTALFSTILIDFGETGYFIDLRPVRYRIPLEKKIELVVQPLGGILMIPVVGGIPLVNLAYRSSINVEFSF